MVILPGDIVENVQDLISDRNKIVRKGHRFKVLATDGKSICLLINEKAQPSLDIEVFYARFGQIRLVEGLKGNIEVVEGLSDASIRAGKNRK